MLCYLFDLSAFCGSLNWIYLTAVLVYLQNHILWNSVFHAGSNCCSFYVPCMICFSKQAVELHLRNFSVWSYHVKPILLFQKLELVLGSCLVTALYVTMTTAVDVGWNVLGPYTKGEQPTLETACEGESSSPDTNTDSSFSPDLPVLSLGCWASAKTGFMSLSFIIKLCWV